MEKPRIRNIEAFPIQDNLICLRDPLHISEQMLALSPQLFYLCTLMDGSRTREEIINQFTRIFGTAPDTETVEELLEKLNKALLLDNEHFQRVWKETIAEFRASPIRNPAHAGSAYEQDQHSLATQLEGFFTSEEGPGLPDTATADNTLAAIIAPHIDLRRGGPCFAHGYHALARSSGASTFIILGITHTPTERRFVLTRKNFVTPFGTLETDQSLVDEIESDCSHDFFYDEFNHRSEHSIEFQTIFLHYLYQGRRDIRIVPILCSGLNDLFENGTSPMENEEVSEFITALQTAIAKRPQDVCLIGGVDFSHVGKRFGQEVTINDQFLHWVEEEDRKMLEPILKGDAEEFFSFIRGEQDKRNVCGVPAIYTLLSLLADVDGTGEPQRAGKLLKYDMAVEDQTQSVVSFAAAAFYR